MQKCKKKKKKNQYSLSMYMDLQGSLFCVYELLIGVLVSLPEILVLCAYFEILLGVCEMTDPLLGAPSQCHIHHPIC